jgi:nucleoside-diphosphate-sugar epimerase
MHILIVGATGVLGRHVTPRLLERGHTVAAVVRRPEQARYLQQMGVDAVLGDILDRASLQAAARGCDAALHLATAIPTGKDQDWSRNDRIRREGTLNLLAAATDNGVRRYIQQSITFLYGDCGQTIVDETAPLRPSEHGQSAVDMETMVKASALDWCILRGGTFYGPGTGAEELWREAAAQRRLALPGDGSDLMSLIHVVDMARAVVVAAERGPAAGIFNIVDNAPVSYRELYTYIAAQAGAAPPLTGGPRAMPSLGCNNTAFKRALAWQLAYPSYRSGLA